MMNGDDFVHFFLNGWEYMIDVLKVKGDIHKRLQTELKM